MQFTQETERRREVEKPCEIDQLQYCLESRLWTMELETHGTGWFSHSPEVLSTWSWTLVYIVHDAAVHLFNPYRRMKTHVFVITKCAHWLIVDDNARRSSERIAMHLWSEPPRRLIPYSLHAIATFFIQIKLKSNGWGDVIETFLVA